MATKKVGPAKSVQRASKEAKGAAEWIGSVSIDSSGFPFYLVDAKDLALLRKPGKKRSGVLEHDYHDHRIDLWRSGPTVFFGEYYLADDDALDAKKGRSKVGALLLGLPALEEERLGVVRVASGVLAIAYQDAPPPTLTDKQIMTAAKSGGVTTHRIEDFDGDLGLVSLAPGEYEVVLAQLGSKNGPVENEFGQFDTRTTIRPIAAR